MASGFQASVTAQPAPAVAGDWCDANPLFTVDAGPGGLVAGASGLIVGLFAWIAGGPSDPNGTGQVANNFGSGKPAGIMHREQQALTSQYLDRFSMTVPKGFPITLTSGGRGLWVKNDGTAFAAVGQKAYANNQTGKVTFAATGATTNGATSNASSIAAATTATLTASIAGDVMTVTSGTGIVLGGTIGGTDGTNAIPTGTTVVSQLSGTTGTTGTYLLDRTPNPFTNGVGYTITQNYGTLTVGGTITGTFYVGGQLGGTGVAANTYIIGLGSGTGGAGTYYLNNTTAMSSSSITEAANTETNFVALSDGAPGELVKISNYLTP